MLSWGSKRKILYIGMTAFFLAFLLVVFVFFVFFERTSCFDKKMNGGETGIDCGGKCLKACDSEIKSIKNLWVRVFEIKDGVYSVASAMENPNSFFEAKKANYRFKIYDSNNVLLAEPRGISYIPPGQVFGVLEGGINLNDKKPVRAMLEWEEPIFWTKSNSVGLKEVSIKDVSRDFNSENSRVIAKVTNQSLKTIKNIFGFVVVYNSVGNVIAASKTVVDEISGSDSEDMVFSWPRPLSSGPVGRVEIFYWLLP